MITIDKKLFFAFFLLLQIFSFSAEAQKSENLASKPLFRDPVFDGTADPVIIWNKKQKV